MSQNATFMFTLTCQQKDSFLSHSFIIETTNTFIHYRSCLVNHARFQTKIGKIHTRFQRLFRPKWHQNHILLGGRAHTYVGVPPSGSIGPVPPQHRSSLHFWCEIPLGKNERFVCLRSDMILHDVYMTQLVNTEPAIAAAARATFC